MQKLLNHIKNKFSKNRKKDSSIKLFMTLVIQDEEDIIEKQILFHKEMGVDGFIVTSHKSKDHTNEILEKLKRKNIVKEILIKETDVHLHSVWVNEMVNIAKTKYNADWVINADADEFYYSKTLNLKEQLINIYPVNVLRVYSHWYIPVDNTNELFNTNMYFVKNPLNIFEYEVNNIEHNKYTEYYEMHSCPKVIHNTKDFISITDGNHFVNMKNYLEISPSDIILYHFHTRSFNALKQKAIKARPTIQAIQDENWGRGWRNFSKLLKNDKLEDFYYKRFEQYFECLSKVGVISKDLSIYNFLKYRGIL
ncbi:MAG: glycosyltransferase family 2 protein [Candidatus Gastranaerophilaceae bacterium]